MVAHHWFPWINTSNSGSYSVTAAKQEQDMSTNGLGVRKGGTCHHICLTVALSTLCLLLLVSCVALSVFYFNESDSKPGWKSLLFDPQNISDIHSALKEANSELRRENKALKEDSDQLQEQTQLLDRTLAKLLSANLALSLEKKDLLAQIGNLTTTNSELSQEQERLVRFVSEQEDKELNMSRSVKSLVHSNHQQEEEKRRLSEMNGLLRDELLQAEENNQRLLELNIKCQGEIRNLSEKVDALLSDDRKERNRQLQVTVAELQERNQNLSRALKEERQDAAEREESRRNETERTMVEMQSMQEAYSFLDRYCPVVNVKTKERICKKCPDSWRLFETKCYYFSSRMLTWSSSRAWCQTQGGDLLVINSEPEQSFILDSSRSQQQKASRLWIGMSDAEEEGEWIWVDGSAVSSDVQFWLSRPGMGAEPDNWKLDDPLGEDCGHIDTSEKALASWMDASCKIPYRWICEKNL